MELLIPGLILVALMVYASTRIKRSAAQAFERETIETDEFGLIKPEGFLSVVNGDPRYAFEAYSREFGTDAAAEFRLATARVTVGETAGGEVEVIDEQREVRGDIHYRLTEAKHVQKGVDLRVLGKEATRDGRTYRLEIETLAETDPEFQRKINEMLDSFYLK